MLDAMEAKFQFLWSVMYSSIRTLKKNYPYGISFITIMYTSFFTSHHTGIFTGKEKKQQQQQQQKNIPGPLKLE
mgnify:CR=1 FL=1